MGEDLGHLPLWANGFEINHGNANPKGFCINGKRKVRGWVETECLT